MIKEAIVKIVNKGDLSYDEAYAVMNEIMSGETTPTQNAAFLAALSTKSARAETTDEIAGCAAAMRDHATKVDTGMNIFEIVGTGGDNAHSFNISTTSALVAAAGSGEFQSTLPARGATLIEENNGQAIDISIHAPRTGSDTHGSVRCPTIRISIHAPRTGSDHHRRPRIHAPARFQSTLPARGATRDDGRRADPRNFNPRSPHGERPRARVDLEALRQFQSTLPARGATCGGA